MRPWDTDIESMRSEKLRECKKREELRLSVSLREWVSERERQRRVWESDRDSQIEKLETERDVLSKKKKSD